MDAAAPSRMPDLSPLDGARILLAEDNANNREVALDFLAAARMQVDVAAHGGEAVKMVQANDYDLVLMDLQMPEVDGLSAARRIRAVPRLHHLPLIAMTAHAMAGDREQSLGAGMNDHVTKPIDPERLFNVLLKWIDPARLAGRRLPAALPPIGGVDWQLALVQVDQQRPRLEKRIRSFLHEYQQAPQIVRDALGGGHDETSYCRLQNLAHNLKSSAAYVGAVELSAVAGTVEQALRAGQHERIGVLAPGLLAVLDTVLAGLATVAAGRAAAADARGLVDQLEACLRSGDTRAEEALFDLQALLAGSQHAGMLAAIARAVASVEYHAALAPLAVLAQALDTNLEKANEPG
jgi:two-component system sensor histidine kinase/response regulator